MVAKVCRPVYQKPQILYTVALFHHLIASIQWIAFGLKDSQAQYIINCKFQMVNFPPFGRFLSLSHSITHLLYEIDTKSNEWKEIWMFNWKKNVQALGVIMINRMDNIRAFVAAKNKLNGIPLEHTHTR